MQNNTEKMAIEARRAYQREWRRKNKDKVKANNLRYWLRKAQKMEKQSAGNMEVE